ncbi:CCR4-NOT core subunit cdc39 [Diaporthe eres]
MLPRSPSTSSPTGNYAVSKITIAQVYVLLSTLKAKKDDPAEYENKVNRLNKLIDENGMEVFTKYFTKLVHTSASQIFPGTSRPIGSATNTGSYSLLLEEMRKISHDVDQATKISESIETGTEDIFRDFDLSTFMEHFRLDALEKTILALAFKLGSRPDLKAKGMPRLRDQHGCRKAAAEAATNTRSIADAILSTNYPTFIAILSQPDGDHSDLSPHFLSVIIDRLIQYHPPNFNSSAHRELFSKVETRYAQLDMATPSEVLAALDLNRVLVDKPPNALALYIQKVGPEFTRDEESCARFLQERPPSVQLSAEQVSNALWYTAISQTPQQSPTVLVAGLRRALPSAFRWQDVLSYFDQPSARISPPQFLRLYRALHMVALEDDGSSFDIQNLWGGNWANADAHLSFVCAFGSLTPEELDATTIPGLRPTFTLAEYAQSPAPVRERAAYAVRHPLVSVDALTAVFGVALSSQHASQTTEAKRLFNEVVVPNLDIFVVSAFGVPKPWPEMANDTLTTLFETFLFKQQEGYQFALDSLWRKDKDFVKQKISDAHVRRPMDLPLYLEHAEYHGWLDEFVYEFSGIGLDLAAFAHGQGRLDIDQWTRTNATRGADVVPALLQFVNIKADMETRYQRQQGGQGLLRTTPLQVKTVYHFLGFLSEFCTPQLKEWRECQRQCTIAYPRLINYGGPYDAIIDLNGADGNNLPLAAIGRMEDHYKSMYSGETQVRDIVEALERYKHSRDPLDQDIFACMIHGLFDEFVHYPSYPIDALARTAVLFGGVISRKLIDGTPQQAGLGMILEAIRDYPTEHNMHKFGLQALMQLYSRFPEWPSFCRQLLQISSLQGTEAWRKAENVVRDQEEDATYQQNGGDIALNHDSLTNGNVAEAAEQQFAPFASINVDPTPAGAFEDPTDDTQDKIQFALNNMDQASLKSRFDTIRESLEQKHQQWFASHLVKDRAKVQPNLHQMYLDVVKLFEDNMLWTEVQRATLSCVAQMLNSESTMHSSTERTQLKNLGGWLGMLTLARDKPIRHRNIAFKQLLIEAHDTKRLIVVIPFVCKVLGQGASSMVFRPPNPWLMDIIHLLIELYHNAELKLNLKFEIEVLCKTLSLDHKSIEPSGEIQNRVVAEEATQVTVPDGLEAFDNLSLNGIGQGVVSNLMPHAVAPTIPDLHSRLNIPPANEMVVSNSRLRDIVHTAFNKALQDIIQPVVDRSVTIAAISTHQMIRKDFATEPDEHRIRNSAISMVKATAGSLALVTSKEPLRANFTNYMRQLSTDLQGGLPEGTIIMCVNSNLELASSVIEDAAERRAIPEIEDLIEPELDARRRHRLQRPNQPYVDASLNRWAMTMPDPYKMAPSLSGLSPEQMAIYEEFQRQPRPATTTTTPSHIASTSDATRSMANEILSDQYNSVPSAPTPAETPAMPPLAGHTQTYPHAHAGLTNGRQPALSQVDARVLVERVSKLLFELQRAATEAPEEHYEDLPRGHTVLDTMDVLISNVIKARTSTTDDPTPHVVEQICNVLLGPLEDSLAIETFAHALSTIRRMGGPVLSDFAVQLFRRQDGSTFLRLPMIKAFIGTDLLDWRTLDEALSASIRSQEEGSLQMLHQIIKATVLSETPMALFANLGSSLEVAYAWIVADPEAPGGEDLKATLDAAGEQRSQAQNREQIEYVFDEWVLRFRNTPMTDKLARNFVKQVNDTGSVRSKDDLLVLIRIALDSSVGQFENAITSGNSIDDGYIWVNALVALVMAFVKSTGFDDTDPKSSPASLLASVWALATMVLNHHTRKRGELFNQRVFFRFFSQLLHESGAFFEQLGEPHKDEMLLKVAPLLSSLGPAMFPGFFYGWLGLIHHAAFLPSIMDMEGEAGWAPYTRLIQQLLEFVGEQLNTAQLPDVIHKPYEAAVKLLIILQHDYPQYLVANSSALLASIPPHCTQLINTILFASVSKMPDPMTAGLDAAGNQSGPSHEGGNPTAFLQGIGLFDILNSALEKGPSEDAVAHMTHAITRGDGRTGFGPALINANLGVIDAITAYIGKHAVQRAAAGQPAFEPGSSALVTLSMLVHELAAEPRHYLLLSMLNHLREPNADMEFFSKSLLEIFSHDLSDPEETEIREQIARVLLERLIGFWPQPWGLLITVVELVKNDKYMFFELPFIKQTPEVSGPPDDTPSISV